MVIIMEVFEARAMIEERKTIHFKCLEINRLVIMSEVLKDNLEKIEVKSVYELPKRKDETIDCIDDLIILLRELKQHMERHHDDVANKIPPDLEKAIQKNYIPMDMFDEKKTIMTRYHDEEEYEERLIQEHGHPGIIEDEIPQAQPVDDDVQDKSKPQDPYEVLTSIKGVGGVTAKKLIENGIDTEEKLWDFVEKKFKKFEKLVGKATAKKINTG